MTASGQLEEHQKLNVFPKSCNANGVQTAGFKDFDEETFWMENVSEIMGTKFENPF